MVYNDYMNIQKKHSIILACIIFIFHIHLFARDNDSKETETIIALPSYVDPENLAYFYGNKLTDINLLGGYGGFDILLENNTIFLSAFIEVGGGINIDTRHIYGSESFSFINFGCRYYF